MLGIIGGSGFEKFDGFETVERLDIDTPFGSMSSGFKRVNIGNQECYFLSRHGEHHELLPSEINYRANIWGFKKVGVSAIVSFSAVGSLAKEYKPGDLVVPNQYIDRTKGVRSHTFCGDGIVGHVSLAKPVCSSMVEKLKGLVNDIGFDCHFDKTYVCIEGPYFSTKAESHTYRNMGAHIIGMTNFPEYALAREAGLGYLPCCFVTDYDCWDDSIPHVTLEEVIQTMRDNNSKAFEVADRILNENESDLLNQCECLNHGLQMGLMTPKEAISKEKLNWLSVLVKGL